MSHRIHIFGASGSGTTTLGAALGAALGITHLDTDRYYWKVTDPPFTETNPPDERIQRIAADTAGSEGWILSGSLCGWGDPLIEEFTLAVLLTLDPAIRLERLRAREARRYGARIQPDGDLHEPYREFLAWAKSYDHAKAPIRSWNLHTQWSRRLRCPVMTLDSARPPSTLVEAVRSAIP